MEPPTSVTLSDNVLSNSEPFEPVPATSAASPAVELLLDLLTVVDVIPSPSVSSVQSHVSTPALLAPSSRHPTLMSDRSVRSSIISNYSLRSKGSSPEALLSVVESHPILNNY